MNISPIALKLNPRKRSQLKTPSEAEHPAKERPVLLDELERNSNVDSSSALEASNLQFIIDAGDERCSNEARQDILIYHNAIQGDIDARERRYPLRNRQKTSKWYIANSADCRHFLVDTTSDESTLHEA